MVGILLTGCILVLLYSFKSTLAAKYHYIAVIPNFIIASTSLTLSAVFIVVSVFHILK